MTWADRLARLSEAKHPHAKTANKAETPPNPRFGNIGTIGRGVFSEKSTANDPAIAVPCSRCATPSRPFIAVINPDLWQCDTCLPADPIDQAYEAIERQAIIAEGRPSETVLIDMPASWSDPSLIPTPGARCRCCNRSAWWCEASSPRGWRCSTCHPGDHLPADRRRDVVT